MRFALTRPLIVLLLVFSSPVVAGDDVNEEIDRFKKSFAGGMTRYTRERALDRLAEIATKKIERVFEWALDESRDEVRRLQFEKDQVIEELRRLEAELNRIARQETERAKKRGLPPPSTVPVPTPLGQALDRTRRKTEAIQEEIDEEFEIRAHAARAFGAWISVLGAADRSAVLAGVGKGPLRDRDWTTRAFYAGALGATKEPEATRLLLVRLAEERDRRVLPLVVDAVAAQAGEIAVTDLVAHLTDERWQIRAAVIAALGRIGSRAAVQPLIDRLRVEDGRLRGDIAAALKALCGVDLGILPDRWQRWWDEHKAVPDKPGETPGANPPDPAPTEDERASFYGIRVDSKRILFVIDVSGSMSEKAAGGKDRSKIEVAKYELTNALLGLPEDAAFNIVFYSEGVSQWKKGMVAAKRKNRRAAAEFVKAMEPAGATNIYDALDRAFHLVGLGARDKHYDLGADTIFFLSDGQPNRGGVVDTTQILAEVKRWNALRRVKIHAVGVGPGHDSGFMKGLAESSGGTYVAR